MLDVIQALIMIYYNIINITIEIRIKHVFPNGPRRWLCGFIFSFGFVPYEQRFIVNTF